MADQRPPVDPTPAATVVPLRDAGTGIEVLLLRRSARGVFGGMWVFPGGQVDEQDLPGRPGSADLTADEIAVARRAAVREAREEAAIELEADHLVVLSFWLPPPESARRFATWFFLAPAGDASDVTVDHGEIHDHRWMQPGAAMEARQSGEIELPPPTFTTLWWLSRYSTAEEALAAAASRPPERYESRLAVTPEGRLGATLWAGDAGYEDCDLSRPGPRRRLVMDHVSWRVEITGPVA